MDETYLSIKEFAKKLGIHEATVRRNIKKGYFQALKSGSGKRSVYRIPLSEINRVSLFNLEEIVQNMVDKKLKE